MTLWQLRAFAAVAKEGGFTKAGKVMHTTQPAVSALIIDLQKELGVKLFERLGMKIHLTEAGRRVLQLAENALATIDKIPEEVEEMKGLKKLKLRVGGSPIAAASFLPTAIQKFRGKYPGIYISFDIQSSDVLERALLEGEVDVALLGWPPDSQQLFASSIHEEELVVIAPPNHPLAKKQSVTLELLSKEPLILSRQGMRTRDLLDNAFAKKAIILTPSMEIGPRFAVRDAIKNAVASGLGIGFISKCQAAADVKAGRVKILRVPEFNLKRTIYIAIHKNRMDFSPVALFKDFLPKILRS